MTNPAEQHVRAFFESHGFGVSAIPCASTKTPDFLVVGDALDYLVEVKVQTPPKENLAEIDTTGRTEIHIDAAGTGALSRKLKDVERQLLAHELDVGRLRIYAVVIEPAWRDALALQLRAALYGMRSGLTGLLSPSAACIDTEVYYFDTPQFARYPDIDLVLMLAGGGVCAMLNEFSPRADRARSSRLAEILGARLHDPRVAIASSDVIECPPEWRSLPVAERIGRFGVERQMTVVQIPTHLWTLVLPLAAFDSGPAIESEP